jgi:hypothetical protein
MGMNFIKGSMVEVHKGAVHYLFLRRPDVGIHLPSSRHAGYAK